MCAKYLESWGWVVGFLHHVIEFGRTVFETGWWVAVYDARQPAVERSGRNAFFTFFNDVERKVKKLRHILACFGTRKDKWCPWYEIKCILDLIKDMDLTNYNYYN